MGKEKINEKTSRGRREGWRVRPVYKNAARRPLLTAQRKISNYLGRGGEREG
jgi:hypothetical protein